MLRFLIGFAFFLAWPASAGDLSHTKDVALISKFVGVCGVMQQMAAFQKATKMPGGDQFVERFWKTEFARLGKSQDVFFKECEASIDAYGKLMDVNRAK